MCERPATRPPLAKNPTFVGHQADCYHITSLYGGALSSSLCVNFASLAFFAVNVFRSFYRKVRKAPQRNSPNQRTPLYTKDWDNPKRKVFMTTAQTTIFVADEVSDSGLQPLRDAGFLVEKRVGL